MSSNKTTSKHYLLGATISVLVSVACSNVDSLGPTDLNQLRFSDPISVGDFANQLGQGPVRAEVKLFDEGLVAREVEVESSDEMTDEEKLEFTVVSIDDAAGTIVVDFADLTIQYDGSTKFEGFDSNDINRADFVALVVQEMSDGRSVGVEAKRPAPSAPQAPDDATFFATELELEIVDDRKIEMNIDSDNLTVNGSDAVLQLLGRQVELRISDGTTELEREDDDHDGEIKFKDFVESTGADQFTLTNGTIVRVIPGFTEIDDGDGDKRLGSLVEVQTALDAGQPVRAKGEAVADPDNAGVLIAAEVRFKIKRQDEQISLQTLAAFLATSSPRAEIELRNGGLVVRELEIESDDDDEDDEEEIEAHIVSTDAAGSVTLDIGGIVVTFDASTKFENFDGDDVSLAQFVAIVDAELAAGRMPRVEAKRPSPTSPQAPDNGVFAATSLELDDDQDERKIEIKIGAANLTINEPRPDGGPDATVQVLGVVLEIRTTEGLTEIELEG